MITSNLQFFIQTIINNRFEILITKAKRTILQLRKIVLFYDSVSLTRTV